MASSRTTGIGTSLQTRIENTETVQTKIQSSSKSKKCMWCRKTFPDDGCLKKHIEDTHLRKGKVLFKKKCLWCTHYFPDDSALKQHIEETHFVVKKRPRSPQGSVKSSKERTFACDLCDEKLFTAKGLELHTKNAHELLTIGENKVKSEPYSMETTTETKGHELSKQIKSETHLFETTETETKNETKENKMWEELLSDMQDYSTKHDNNKEETSAIGFHKCLFCHKERCNNPDHDVASAREKYGGRLFPDLSAQGKRAGMIRPGSAGYEHVPASPSKTGVLVGMKLPKFICGYHPSKFGGKAD